MLAPTAVMLARPCSLVVLVLLDAARVASLWARGGHALPRQPSMDSPTPPPNPIGAKTRDRAGSVKRRRSRSRRDAVGALDRFRPVPIIPRRVGGRPCTFPGIGDGQHRTPARGAGFPRAGAGKILPRPRRTVGGEEAGRPEPYKAGHGAAAPRDGSAGAGRPGARRLRHAGRWCCCGSSRTPGHGRQERGALTRAALAAREAPSESARL